MDAVDKFPKAPFMESMLQRHKELGKRQREYIRVMSTKIKTRKDQIVDASYQTSINQLEEEKDDLRAQIWVASGTTNGKLADYYLSQIQCHVECQENLSDDIKNLKTAIFNMDRQTSNMARELYGLNQQTISDQRHIDYVAKMRKKMAILENTLENNVRQECAFAADNAQLREQLMNTLSSRHSFNDSYTKLVQKLNSDKKYMLELMDYAVGTFDDCIEAYEKIEILKKMETKEGDLRRMEMQFKMRKLTADTGNLAFLECKGKPRELADLPLKEYKRRDNFRRLHKKKIGLYTSVLRKVRDLTESNHVAEVIDKFQQQESLYYTFFQYNNEMSYHITMLNHSVNRLYKDIAALHVDNSSTLQEQLDKISSLEEQVHQQQDSNMTLLVLRENNDATLENLLQGLEAVCKICKVDVAPLAKVLGSHAHVNLVNVNRFLKMLESRVHELTASVYVTERHDNENNRRVVRGVDKICGQRTELSDIVLTQQCPECAEGEAFNMDEGGDLAHVHTVNEARKKLYEKITQPEIQYRLHSLSQCRLPRSRILAAKRLL
ncbi:hypothetical protein KR009_011298 [Drosophila setifemur]|nr:hypothetical protein KR009_011298 [Drosophila setifemur]